MTKRAIVVAVDDMFFAAKIRATGEAVGVMPRFAVKDEDVIRAALDENPSLIIFDLHSQRLDAFELARRIKGDEQLRHIRLLGFFSHVQTELERKASEAGFDEVIPRSAFSRRLAEILQTW
jgi:PleD family two-component response regulator